MDDDLEALLHAADAHCHGPGRTAAFADVARRADAERDERISFWARMGQLDAAMMASQYHVALALFPRLLKDVDADPDACDDGGQLMVTFPSLLTGATCFPDVPLSRLRELGEEFARRGEAEGLADAEITDGLLNLAQATGDLDRAAELLHRMSHPWNGHFALCEHCRVRQRLDFAWYADDLPAIREHGRRLIDGRLTCVEYVCHGLREPFVLRALVDAGEDETAVRYYGNCAAILRSEPHRVHAAGLCAMFLGHVVARGGVSARSAEVAKRDLQGLLRRTVPFLGDVAPDDRMQFLSAASPSLETLARTGDAPALAFPKGDALAPLAGAAGRSDPAPLIAAMDAEAEALALAFDRRNGNDFHLRLHRRARTFVFGAAVPANP
ncbi:hypothetical protein [Alienimonas chondri]|uniref:Tetratricopeptide repeat protein n=1 Tax=Alienimonas chondri TaxID=2681879 RepID=A0ABX1VCQ0_9PLAN|nr:hypothetical protein [Alienimonas chondri]NNJ25295.1 hypothetical protein [Alienimonas chondri]